MIGTSFGLSADTIRIAGSRILFDDYAVYAPNKSALTVGGEVSLADFGRMTADLALRASDFQFVDVARKAGTAVYGKAYLDLGATAKGPWTNSSSAATSPCWAAQTSTTSCRTRRWT